MTNNSPQSLTLNELKLVSHSLGIGLLERVLSRNLKDKKLPISYYRNYYNASLRQAAAAGINSLVDRGCMIQIQPEYYAVTDGGIKQFEEQFKVLAIYKPRTEMDIDYLKHRINFYCDFMHYRFCDDNSEHIFSAYKDYWLKGHRVSHTTENVIKIFQSELKRFFKPKIKQKQTV